MLLHLRSCGESVKVSSLCDEKGDSGAEGPAAAELGRELFDNLLYHGGVWNRPKPGGQRRGQPERWPKGWVLKGNFCGLDCMLSVSPVGPLGHCDFKGLKTAND